ILLTAAAPVCMDLRSDRDARGYGVEPGTNQFAVADGTGLANEHKERGLECVLGVFRVVKRPPAHAPDGWRMPLYENGESGVILFAHKTLQQFDVGELRNSFAAKNVADPMDNAKQRACRHYKNSWEEGALYRLVPRAGRRVHYFW